MAPKHDSRPEGPNEENDAVEEATPTQTTVLPGDQDMRPRWVQNGDMLEEECTEAEEQVMEPMEEHVHVVVEDEEQPMEGARQPAWDSALLARPFRAPGPRPSRARNWSDGFVDEELVPISDAPDGVGDDPDMKGIALREFWPGAKETND